MWVLQNFPEHLLVQNTSGGCFCIYWFDAWKNQNQSIKYVLRQKQLTSETVTLISLILTEIYMEILIHIWTRYRSSHQKCCLKKVFLKISENLLENTCTGFSFLKKLQVSDLQFYQKRDSNTVFSYESYDISKNNFLQNTSEGLLLPWRDRRQILLLQWSEFKQIN